MVTENEVPESTPEETPVEETAPAEPTEDLSALLQEIRQEVEKEAQEKYKGIQRVIAQKDQTIRELRTSMQKPAPAAVNLSAQVIELMEAGDFEKAKALIAQQEQQRTLADRFRMQEQTTEAKRGELRQQITEAGLDPDDDAFDTVWLSVDLADAKDGNFAQAEKRLTRAMAKQKPKPAVEPVVDERTLEQKALELLRKRDPDLLKTDIGGPPSVPSNFNQLRDAYITDPDNVQTRQRYMEARKQRGL